MTSVLLEFSDEWVMADLAADPRSWSRSVVRERAAQEELDLPSVQLERLADVLVPALESARAQELAPLMVLFLLPTADVPALCHVTVRAEMLTPGTTLAEVVDEVRLPVPMLELPAEESTVQTRSGEAVHLVQRYRSPVDPDHEIVQEHEVFVWQVSSPEGELAIYLSTAHLDLVQAALVRGQLVELASTLTLVPDN